MQVEWKSGTGRGVRRHVVVEVEAHAKVKGNVQVGCGEEAASVDQFLSL